MTTTYTSTIEDKIDALGVAVTVLSAAVSQLSVKIEALSTTNDDVRKIIDVVVPLANEISGKTPLEVVAILTGGKSPMELLMASLKG